MSDTSLEMLAQEIVSEHRLVFRSALDHAVRAGQLLIQVKETLPHGEWLDWVDANCGGLSRRTAQEYMRLAEASATWDDEKRNDVAHMSLRKLLQLTATPKPAIEQPAPPETFPTGNIAAIQHGPCRTCGRCCPCAPAIDELDEAA